MSYEEAMKSAGANILAFKEFGSYQGDWFALVEYQGKRGFIHGSYGSCSGCDAFEAEFGNVSEDECVTHKYEGHHADCPVCVKAKAEYPIRLAKFGESYLDGITDYKTVREHAAEDLDWDREAQNVVNWLDATFAKFFGS